MSALNKVSAGVFCNQLSKFLSTVATSGFAAAAAGLDPIMGAAILTIAGIFGVTEACESAAGRKKASDLGEQIRKLASRQEATLIVLEKIANQETGVTLDEFARQELAETVVAALKDAGVEPGLPPDNFAEASIVPNADFVGRREILDDLHRRLGQGDVALTHDLPGAPSQALTGEGGVGKTQIAIRYAYEHADDYAGRWWLDASKEPWTSPRPPWPPLWASPPARRTPPSKSAGPSAAGSPAERTC